MRQPLFRVRDAVAAPRRRTPAEHRLETELGRECHEQCEDENRKTNAELRGCLLLTHERVHEPRASVRSGSARRPTRRPGSRNRSAGGAASSATVPLPDRKARGPGSTELAQRASGEYELAERRERFAHVSTRKQRNTSDVDATMIATKTGSLSLSSDSTITPAIRASTAEHPYTTNTRPTRPRIAPTSSSSPARNNRNDSPISARTVTGTSTWTQSSPDGPTAIPSTISRTTAGIRNRGVGETGTHQAQQTTIATTGEEANERAAAHERLDGRSVTGVRRRAGTRR